jgi:Fe-S-cluster containining protein
MGATVEGGIGKKTLVTLAHFSHFMTMPFLIKFHPAFFHSPLGVLRYLRMKLLGRQVIVRGQCEMCGACCKKISLDIGGSWVRSVRRFKRLVRKNSDYARFEITGRDRNGYLEFRCTWLQKDGTCRDYDNRLQICRSYPDTELYFTNGKLIKGCGFALEEVPDFERLLKRKIRRERGGEKTN